MKDPQQMNNKESVSSHPSDTPDYDRIVTRSYLFDIYKEGKKQTKALKSIKLLLFITYILMVLMGTLILYVLKDNKVTTNEEVDKTAIEQSEE